jgi:polar amino acid transport system substrate-binding protein
VLHRPSVIESPKATMVPLALDDRTSTAAAYAAVTSGSAEAVAGLRDSLLNAAKQLPGSRVLDGHFMVAQQAIGIAKGREAAAGHLNAFVEDMKASGLVSREIAASGAWGVSVAR